MTRLRRPRLQGSLLVLSAIVAVAGLAGSAGYDTGLRLGLHVELVVLLVTALLCAAAVLHLRHDQAVVAGLVVALALVGATAVPHADAGPRGEGMVVRTTPDGRHSVVGTPDGAVVRFWLEEHRGPWLRRVPLGCAVNGTGWGVAAHDDRQVLVQGPATFSDGTQRPRMVDVAQAMRDGGAPGPAVCP